MKYNLKISSTADADLDAIYEYGFHQWGEMQADRYYDDLLKQFDQITENPFLYAAIDELALGYRRCVCGSHSIFYRINNDVVEVMAIIGKQDISTLF